MSRPLRPATTDDVERIGRAISDLRRVRDELKLAGARKSAQYVGRAIKSTEGALRHAERRERYTSADGKSARYPWQQIAEVKNA